jgi:hypothetical protein
MLAIPLMNSSLAIFLAVNALCALIALALQWAFLARLRKQHPEVLATFGEPVNVRAVWGMLWRHEHHALKYWPSVLLGDLLRTFLTGFILLLISLIIHLLYNGRSA